MIDIGTPLRTSYLSTLQGNVIISGQPVLFADEKLEASVASANHYVLLLDQIEDEGIPNKTKFVNDAILRMRIVDQRKATNDKEIVESISSQILNLLFPARATWNISLSAPLSLTSARFIGGEYSPFEETSNGFIITKVLSFRNRIVQP